ncbi:MFS transporter [Anoxybacillus ayderensis]|uniref:MFS transporter n=1 Tax=Anoxybacillus ayderensis TaxID=265546 RepID=UPI002E219B94|nr:MFS transporter [Anoxybacillus ayderensis]MED0686679.1 MFS transporter [Anoxybacillus ayderensis]
MNKWKRMVAHVRTHRQLFLLLAIGGLYSLSIALSNTFVNVYVWKKVNSFQALGVYNLAIVTWQPLAFIVAGQIAKKIDRVIVLRMGVTFLAFFFLVVLFSGDRAMNHLFLLGGLLGIGYGFYWLAFNVLTFEITEPNTRDLFNGLLGAMTSVAGMIGPPLSGWVIASSEKFTGYMVIFLASLCLFIAAVICSFFLQRRRSAGQFSLRSVYDERKKNKNWRMITNAHFFQGFREGTFVFIVSIFLFMATGTEKSLGVFGFVNAVVSFMTYSFASKWMKRQWRLRAILFGGVLLYASVFLIIFDLSYVKLIIYGALIAIGYPILLVPYLSLTFDVIGQSNHAKEWRIEYIVMRELFLNGGRATSVLLFLLAITLFDAKEAIPSLMLIVGAGHFIIYFFVRRIRLSM